MKIAPHQQQNIDIADHELHAAGLPTYTDLLILLRQAQRLGLSFDIGSAYIRRSYIDAQDALNAQINALPKAGE